MKTVARRKLILAITFAAAGFLALLVTRRAENSKVITANLPLRPGLSSWERLSLDWDRTNLNQAELIYGELTGRKLFVPGTTRILHAIDDGLGRPLSRFGILSPPALTQARIQVHGDGLLQASEVKEACETLFAGSSLQPVPEGRHYFRLVRIRSSSHPEGTP